MDKWHGKAERQDRADVAASCRIWPSPPLRWRAATPTTELAELVPELIPAGGAADAEDAAEARRTAAALAAMTPEERQAFQDKLRNFFKDEGVLLTITANGARRKRHACSPATARRAPAIPPRTCPQVAITAENYNRIARLLEHNVPVKLAFDIKTQFDTTNTDSFNVIAEIPGATKPNELVMVGGHFDSWHYGHRRHR